MNKLLLSLVVLILSFNAISQLKIIEEVKKEQIGIIKTSGINWFECTKYEGESYLFTYRNWKYKTIFEYESFRIKGNQTFNELYEVLISSLTKKEKKNVDIDLGNGETLSLRFAGKKTMEFWVWNGSSWSYSCPMNIKGVNMLWGKTK